MKFWQSAILENDQNNWNFLCYKTFKLQAKTNLTLMKN